MGAETERVAVLLATWHERASMESLPPPPPRERIEEIESWLGTPLPAEIRYFFEHFRCDEMDHCFYLQYSPAMAQVTAQARANDGWAPDSMVRLPEDEVVFYEDGAGNYGTFQVRPAGSSYRVFERDHDLGVTEYERFSQWLGEHLDMLMTVLDQEEAELKRPKRWWQFWR